MPLTPCTKSDSEEWCEGSLVVVVTPVQAIRGGAVVAFGEVDGGDLEIVLGLSGRVGTEEDTVNGVRFV